MTHGLVEETPIINQSLAGQSCVCDNIRNQKYLIIYHERIHHAINDAWLSNPLVGGAI